MSQGVALLDVDGSQGVGLLGAGDVISAGVGSAVASGIPATIAYTGEIGGGGEFPEVIDANVGSAVASGLTATIVTAEVFGALISADRRRQIGSRSNVQAGRRTNTQTMSRGN